MTTEYKDFYWVNEITETFLKRGYLKPKQTTQERVREIANNAEKLLGIPGFADKFYGYMAQGYYSLSSPVWSNYGTQKGLPVSCFGSYADDTMESILYTLAEVGMLSKNGGGTSGYFGALRHRGAEIKNNGESSGSVHFMKMFDTSTDVISQGSVRRGFFSPYLDIEHGDYDEFVAIGNEGHPIQNLTHGVVVSDKFMEEMIAGNEEWRRRWAKLIQNRIEVGYPYILFGDTVNKNKPEVYKDKNMKIHASNMCSEIALPSSTDESFVCVLSSMNIHRYDSWKETDAVETMIMFLDSVVSEFLLKIEDMNDMQRYFLQRVYNFAKNHRALGLGVLGWHTYLQSKMISFESKDAAKLNLEIIKTIRTRADKASKELAVKFGEPEVLKGYGRRNTTLLAVAPTKSSSEILGQVSQSVEPLFSNYYVKDLAKIKYTFKNPYLEDVLSKYSKNTEEVWQTIKDYDGSCQHLEFLTDHERDVFKTITEINPEAIINQAAIRQEYVDQAQSINIMIDPRLTVKEINAIYIMAWKLGLKSLYYQYSMNAAQSYSREKYMNRQCEACSA